MTKRLTMTVSDRDCIALVQLCIDRVKTLAIEELETEPRIVNRTKKTVSEYATIKILLELGRSTPQFRESDVAAILETAGFSAKSASSTLSLARREGLIERISKGLYKLKG